MNFRRHLASIMVLGLLLPEVAATRMETFLVKRGRFHARVPNAWQVAEGLFGIPYTFLAPPNPMSQRRALIQVIPITDRKVDLSPAMMNGDQGAYMDGKEAWLKSRGGASVEYYPYKKSKWAGVKQVHKIGFRYRMNGDELISRSYYVECKKKGFYLIKTLMPAPLLKSYSKQMNGVLRSFRCGR